MDFNAEAYWETREKKVWVVVLYQRKRGSRKRERTDRKIVRACTKEGAIKTARFFSSLPKIVAARARLATPYDLGCVPTPTRQDTTGTDA